MYGNVMPSGLDINTVYVCLSECHLLFVNKEGNKKKYRCDIISIKKRIYEIKTID